MRYKKLPQTDCQVSTIALGTWVFGGSGWGGTREKDCIDAVGAARDLGVNFIDTAPIYGAGRAEELVGKAIQGNRDKWIIATKCGLVYQGSKVVHNLSAASLKREIDESLRRLNVAFVDLYQCHWPDPNTPIEETINTLIELQKLGKIRFFGVSNFGAELLQQVIKLAPVPILQTQYSILERSIENDILPYVHAASMGILAYGSLAGGILSGKYDALPSFGKGDVRRFFYKFYEGDSFSEAQQILAELEKINRPLNQVAINWVRQKPEITSVLVGCRNLQQVRDNMAAMNWELSAEQLNQIDALKKIET